MKPHSQSTVPPARDSMRSVIVGTAGHIDHGKTSLVFALTGIDTDRLPEEKSRGITVDLGFASMRLPNANGPPAELSLIDVPGHHAFIRNMLAGVGGIDCILLIVAADEGVKAQTEEHLAVCALLGLQHGVVVLTKRDAVSPERLAAVRAEVERFVQGTFLQHAEVVAVSAWTGEGLPELKAALARSIAQVPRRDARFVPRLPVDRAFTVRGFGTVITGTLLAGSLHAEQTLELQPASRSVRVRGVQVHGRARNQAHAPSRVALNLAGIDVTGVRRGDMLVPPGTLAAINVMDCEISVLPGAPVLQHRSTVRVHAFASESLATLLLYGSEQCAGPEPVLARLRLAKPMVLVPGDSFVLRQLSPALTLGGGRVLDIAPVRGRKSAVQPWLQELKHAGEARQVLLRVQRRGLSGVDLVALSRETGLKTEVLAEFAVRLISAGDLESPAAVGAPPACVISADALAEAQRMLLRELERARGTPIPRAQLQSRARLRGWVVDLALRALATDRRIQVEHGLLSTSMASASPPAPRDHRIARIEAMFRDAGLASPTVNQAAGAAGLQPSEIRPIITALLREKQLVRMGSDQLLMHSDALDKLIAALQRRRGESFDVAKFKALTGLTRKHLIPLLEYLDGARVTRNDGGLRIVL